MAKPTKKSPATECPVQWKTEDTPFRHEGLTLFTAQGKRLATVGKALLGKENQSHLWTVLRKNGESYSHGYACDEATAMLMATVRLVNDGRFK